MWVAFITDELIVRVYFFIFCITLNFIPSTSADSFGANLLSLCRLIRQRKWLRTLNDIRHPSVAPASQMKVATPDGSIAKYYQAGWRSNGWRQVDDLKKLKLYLPTMERLLIVREGRPIYCTTIIPSFNDSHELILLELWDSIGRKYVYKPEALKSLEMHEPHPDEIEHLDQRFIQLFTPITAR